MKPTSFCWSDLLRGAVLFFALFTGMNLLGERLVRGFDANEWWLIIPGASPLFSDLFLTVFTTVAIAFCARPQMGKRRHAFTTAVFAGCGFVALWNCLQFATLVLRHRISAGFAIPLSLAIAGLMFGSAVLAWREAQPRRARFLPLSTGLCGCALLFPIFQMVCFGKTDYRRPADAAIVFGARVYANGNLSDALKDRVRTACDLYHQHLVHKLIMSGGPGDGAIHETEAMKRHAMRLGVKEADIFVDEAGLNTLATVRNTTAQFHRLGIRRALAVSHFYHLPRVKMAYQRAGWEVYTVPAQSDQVLAALPLFMLREVAALGKYYFDPPAKRSNG
jgi:uncharacterized SAM-binding protein YcdF (DUF218 family)